MFYGSPLSFIQGLDVAGGGGGGGGGRRMGWGQSAEYAYGLVI